MVEHLELSGRTDSSDIVRLLALACFAMAVLGFAQEVLTLVRAFALPANEETYRIGVSLALHAGYWCLLLALPVAGAGVLYRRRWAWWLAVGCSVASVVLTIVSCFEQILAAEWFAVSLVSKVSGRVLQPGFSVTFLVLLLLPSTRASFPRPIDPGNWDLPEATIARLTNQARAMGCLVLLMAAQFVATGVTLANISLARTDREPAAEVSTPVGYDEWLEIVTASDNYVLFPATALMAALTAVAGVGLIRRRPWSRRATLLAGGAWIAFTVLVFIVNRYILTKCPSAMLPGSPPVRTVARAVGESVTILDSFEQLLFPVLMIAFVRLPGFRATMNGPALPLDGKP